MPGLITAEKCSDAIERYAGIFVEGLMRPYVQDEFVYAFCEVVIAERF